MKPSIMPAATCQASEKAEPSYDFFPGQAGSPSAQVIVVHGLNTRPEVMDPLAKILSSAGYNVYRLRLSRPPTGSGSELAGLWISELASLYCELKNRAPFLPIYNLSFSLGSAVSMAFIQSNSDAVFEKSVFLSPAITLHNYSLPFQLLAPIVPGKIKLPSIAPEEYRELSFTRVAEYHAVFLLSKYVRSRSSGRYSSSGVLVIQNRDDELVSWSKLKRWLISENLDWGLFELNERGDKSLPNHIIVDERSLGAAGWKTVTQVIREFFSSDNGGRIQSVQPSCRSGA